MAAIFGGSSVVGEEPKAVDPARRPAPPAGGRALLAGLSANPIARDAAIRDLLISGRMPSWMKPVPVKVAMVLGGRLRSLTYFAMPDYLTLGTDADHVSVPMSYANAKAVADAYGMRLPTRRMVEQIYAAAAARLAPHPQPAGADMRSTAYVLREDALIEAEKTARGVAPGALVAGHKKDLVDSPRASANPGREAIFGWQQANGVPIQPLSFAHDTSYDDYSQGARLIAPEAVLDGEKVPIEKILKDQTLCPLLSDEGVF